MRVTIERTVTIIFSTKLISNKSAKVAKRVIILVMFVNILSSIHDSMNRRLIIDEEDPHA